MLPPSVKQGVGGWPVSFSWQLSVVTRIVLAFLASLAGGLLGLGLTALSVETPPDFGVVQAGPWVTRPKIGTAEADPYSKALMAVRGALPMAAAEGLMLTATRDSAGASLNGQCTYKVAGPTPGASYWTLTAYDPEGGSGERHGVRAGFTSAEIVRFENQPAAIVFSAQPRPGNWVPLRADRPFELILRLYELQVSASAHAIDATMLPAIERVSCP